MSVKVCLMHMCCCLLHFYSDINKLRGYLCKHTCPLPSGFLLLVTVQQCTAAAKGLFFLYEEHPKGPWLQADICLSSFFFFSPLTTTAAAKSAILPISLTYSESLPSTDNPPHNRWATAGRKEIAWPYCLPSPPLCSSQIKGFLINWKVLCCGP